MPSPKTKSKPVNPSRRRHGGLATVVVCACLMAWPAIAQERARGVIVALDKATLSSELSAKVLSIPKRMGERFVQGEILIQLDCAIFMAQKDKVEAELKAANTKYENTKQLNQLRSIGTLEVALAQADVEKIEAERRIAHLNTERCQLQAPFDGVVENLQISQHEIVKQQQPLIAVIGHKRLEAELIVPAQWIAWLTIGHDVQIVIEETQQQVKAKLSHIAPAIDPVSQTLQLRVVLQGPQKGILPGMSVLAIF